jgi:hypothetical protein
MEKSERTGECRARKRENDSRLHLYDDVMDVDVGTAVEEMREGDALAQPKERMYR